MSKSNRLGLHYKALDLHVHTPASGSDYQDHNITPDDIVDKAISEGLHGICITDHNSGDWIDKVNSAAQGKPITVFPGVEISASGGKNGSIHIIAIFEPGSGKSKINDLLANVGLLEKDRGKTTVLASGDINQVIKTIVEHDGVAVLAHADSNHGVLNDLSGSTRINIIQDSNLSAAEVTSEKTLKFLDGTDPNYKRKLPVYEASDAHSLDEIGSKRTYFRIGNLTLSALRQCFIDSDLHICRENEFNQKPTGTISRILRMEIVGGFFDKVFIDFHPYQNTIIGGQGVGKSLLVEFIRFALNQISSIEQIQDDTNAKLQKELGIGGKITLNLILDNGIRYKITRTYDGQSNPNSVINENTNEIYEGRIEKLFPIMAYSQTEAVYLSRNTQAQLHLIDQLIDIGALEYKKQNIVRQLSENDKKFVSIINARERLLKLKTLRKTKEEELKNLISSL